MKRILIITIGYPHPRRGASSVVFYCYIAALRRSEFKVEHWLIVQPEEESTEAEIDYLEAISPGSHFDVKTFVVPMARGVKRSGLMLTSCELPDEVLARVRVFQPNAVVCFDILAAAMAQRMQLQPLLIWLGDLTFQTILHHAYLDCRENPRKVVRVIRSYFASLLWKSFYRKVLSGQQNVVVSSYSSVAHMAQLGVSTRYWPYPWPCEPCRETTDVGKYSKPTFILFGTLSALGSRSSFDFLLKSVYPHLLRAWGPKSFTILIAGSREPPSWVQAHIQACTELEFLGFVDDLAAEVARCHAVLAPISVPIGNRSRIVTAMSMGALVVAHTNTGLGNPELVSGENCLLASTASKFAEYMVLAHANPDLAAKLAASARQTYLRSFLPEVVSQKLVQELNFILSSS